ncbi:MAG: alpha/beta hydrolase, partial [Chloroflexota bacterium]
NQLGGALVEPQSDLDLLRTALATPEFAWPDIISFVRGNRFSMNALWSELQRYDARTRHTSIEIPITLVLGRNDRVISPRLGAEYLDALRAPEKELIWFEASAHSPLYEEPEKFNTVVRQVAQRVGLLTQ